MYLRSFNFKVEHVPGKDNEFADALSREPADTYYVEDTELEEALLPPETRSPPQEIRIASTIAQDLRARIINVQTDDPPDEKDSERFLQPGQTLRFVKDAYYVDEHGKQPRLYVPYACRADVISYYHDDPLAGHPGCDETLRTVREHYFWPRMREDIHLAVGSCATCSLVKASKPIAKGANRPREPFAPWDTVAIDLMGPYPRTQRKKRFVLVVTDVMSRWVEAFAVLNSELKTIAPIIENEVFRRWGYPRVVLTDNGPQFRGTAWQEKCKAWGVLAYTTPAYHPQTNTLGRKYSELSFCYETSCKSCHGTITQLHATRTYTTATR